MKRFSSQLFPLTILTLLAGLTFWLQDAVDRESTPAPGKPRHIPDAIAENFSIRRFDTQGQLKYRLQAPYLRHFPDDDSSEIQAPQIFSYREQQTTLELSAEQAQVTSGGETVYLTGNVTATRPSHDASAPTVARMPDLLVNTEAGTAQTEHLVSITRGPSLLQGIGMQIDNNAATFTLLSQVRGNHLRQRESQ